MIDESNSVWDVLHVKHPKARPLQDGGLPMDKCPVDDPHPVIFGQIMASVIKSTALKPTGTVGPSNVDAGEWRRFSSSFHRSSFDLCDALARVARRLCSSFVEPLGVSALAACRLLALDKCPGVRPTGIGKVSRWIIVKSILSVIGGYIQATAVMRMTTSRL